MKKKYTYLQVIEKAERYCAVQERCKQDIISKCFDWQLEKSLHEQVLVHLEQQDYINEERFANAYVRSKFNFKNRGRNKLLFELRMRKIDEEIIQMALSQIEKDNYQEKILKLIQVKLRSLKKYDFKNKKLKLIQYLMQKGYEYDIIKQVLDQKEVQQLILE